MINFVALVSLCAVVTLLTGCRNENGACAPCKPKIVTEKRTQYIQDKENLVETDNDQA